MGEPVKLPMKKGLGQTDRTDGWWKGPTAMAAYLGFMIIYAVSYTHLTLPTIYSV